MEKLIVRFFKFSYFILSSPYELTCEPGLLIVFTFNKSLQYYLWLVRFFMKLVYGIICWSLFVHYLPNYRTNNYFDAIAFHSNWGMVTILALVHQVTHLTSSREVVQVSGIIVKLIKNLEHGNIFNILILLLFLTV